MQGEHTEKDNRLYTVTTAQSPSISGSHNPGAFVTQPANSYVAAC